MDYYADLGIEIVIVDGGEGTLQENRDGEERTVPELNRLNFKRYLHDHTDMIPWSVENLSLS